VIECDPTLRLLSLNVAIPDEFKFTVPRRLVPSKKLTVPSGEPVGAGETVAVRRTAWPKVAGLGEAVSAVVVLVAPAPLNGIGDD
jgi:hypothetical protein